MKTFYPSLLFFSAALLLHQPCTGAPGRWALTSSMISGHAEHTATLMPNGDVLVVGGYWAQKSAERYNASANTPPLR